jgi:hypothetical protein
VFMVACPLSKEISGLENCAIIAAEAGRDRIWWDQRGCYAQRECDQRQLLPGQDRAERSNQGANLDVEIDYSHFEKFARRVHWHYVVVLVTLLETAVPTDDISTGHRGERFEEMR